MRFLSIILVFFGSSAWAQETAPKEPQVQEKTSNLMEGWRFGIGGSVSLVSKLKFNDVVISGYSGKYDVDFDFKNGFSLELDARTMNPQSWGFMGGLSYDSEREVSSLTVTDGSGLSSSGSISGMKIQTTVIYGNAVYRWNEFYLPFGLNLSKVNATTAASNSTSGGLGLQLGVGYYINENFVIEALSRATAVKLKTSSASTDVDFGTGYMSNLMITGKYIF